MAASRTPVQRIVEGDDYPRSAAQSVGAYLSRQGVIPANRIYTDETQYAPTNYSFLLIELEGGIQADADRQYQGALVCVESYATTTIEAGRLAYAVYDVLFPPEMPLTSATWAGDQYFVEVIELESGPQPGPEGPRHWTACFEVWHCPRVSQLNRRGDT